LVEDDDEDTYEKLFLKKNKLLSLMQIK